MTDMAPGGELGERAVVVGAGMGGLMAAEALSRHFAQVLILEQDVLPAEPQARMGAAQGAHAHTLLVQGRRNLERLFPGLTSELLDRGAICSRSGLELRIHDAGGWQPARDLELAIISMSRPLLETTVREFLARNRRVTIRDGAKVEGWAFAGDVLTGVRVEGQAEPIAADFVVDAAGRNGASIAWLEAAGFGPVDETALEIGTGYASAVFKKPANWGGRVDSVSIAGAAPDSRGGFAFSVENDCWFVSLTGRFDQQPTADPDKYLAFAKSLCAPDIYDWISQGERVTPIKIYRAPISRWRRYEKLARYPQRLLPLGDALAHVNPLFGQGMTLASAHAVALWEVLAEAAATGGALEAVAPAYFEQVHGVTQTVWRGLENIEFSYATTKGERPADIDARQAFSRGMRRLIEEDPEAHRLMVGIAHLVVPPDALRRPDIASRAMAFAQAAT